MLFFSDRFLAHSYVIHFSVSIQQPVAWLFPIALSLATNIKYSAFVCLVFRLLWLIRFRDARARTLYSRQLRDTRMAFPTASCCGYTFLKSIHYRARPGSVVVQPISSGFQTLRGSPASHGISSLTHTHTHTHSTLYTV